MKQFIPLFAAFLLGCPDYTFKSTQTDPATGKDPLFDTGEAGPVAPTDTGEDEPISEDCNGVDDNGDGQVDEGYPDTDVDGIADCVDEEECDGLDNNGDGFIDEGFDADTDGIPDCLEIEHSVTFNITVDDTWDGAMDGSDISASTGWSGVETFEWTLDSGPHVLTVHGIDIGRAISAFLGSVEIDGTVQYLTGDGSWRMTDVEPDPTWALPGYDDSGWATPVPCTDLSPWGDWTGLPLDQGARWVWYHPAGNCRDSSSWGEAWFRLEFDLP